MPVDFLTEEQKTGYGQFNGEPNEAQLARYFLLDEADLAFISERRGEQNRLGFALQITVTRFLGTLLSELTVVPQNVQAFVANQLSIKDINVLSGYAKRDNTKWEHMALIRSQYGYHDFGNPPWSFRLSRLLYSRAWISNERPSLMFDFATAWLIQNKVLLPGATTLTRLISEIRERATNRLWRRLSSLPSDEQKVQLDSLLEITVGQRNSQFDRFRKGPVTISGPAFNDAINRYKELDALGMQDLDFSHIPLARLKSLARHAGMISMYKVGRMADEKRTGFLVAFVRAFEAMSLDDALDVLDMLITKIAGEAKKIGQKKRLRSLKDLDQSALTLAEVCAMIVNDETEDGCLRGAIYSRISKEDLAKTILTVHDLARPSDESFQKEMVEQYGRVRRFLPKLLSDIVFKAAPAGQTTLDALNYLAKDGIKRTQYLGNPPLDIVSGPWKRLVFDQEDRVTRRGYTLCLLDKLQDALRRRDIYVEQSERWGDPRAKLLQGAAWQSNRVQVCRSLGHPIKPKEAIAGLVHQLDATYKQVAANFDNNTAVNLDLNSKTPSLTITNLEKQEKPESLTRLSEQVSSLLPAVDLTELLLEIHAHTGFADEFTHVSEANARAEDLNVSICAVLLAEACNIGLEPLIKHQ